MGSNKTKSVTELTDEELLSLVESDEEVLDYTSKSDVQPFLTRFSITSGPLQVSSTSVYKFYKIWSEESVDKPTFIQELSVLLNQQTEDTFNLNKAPVEFLNKPKKQKKPTNLVSFYNFIKDLDVQEGKHLVHLEALRLLYNKWAGKRKLIRISFKRFRPGISKFLKIETIDRQQYTLVDAKTRRKIVEIVNEKQKTKKQTRSD